MRIAEQGFEIVFWTDIKHIEGAGRTCYKSGEKIGEDTYPPFIKGLIKRHHGAMLEHGMVMVRLITSRAVTHELVRHRLASFAQESQRYVQYDNVEFIRPVWCPTDTSPGFEEWTRRMLEAEIGYRHLIDMGWPAEQARDVLPNATKTEIVVTANYREWRHIMSLRALGTTGRPHPQMQALMLPLLRSLKTIAEPVFSDLELPEA